MPDARCTRGLMKAGLVINAFVAAAFQKFGSAPCPIKLLITADEEIASPSSRPVIEREARVARAVYNSEPGRPTGNVVTGRKGGVFMNDRCSRPFTRRSRCIPSTPSRSNWKLRKVP